MIAPVCRPLPSTKTHARRHYHWCRTGGETVGTLAIVQGRREAETYAVDEDTAEPFPVRTWLLAKAADGEVYGVTIDPAGWRCTCTGFVTARSHGRPRTCKHVEAVRDLFESGDLDGAD